MDILLLPKIHVTLSLADWSALRAQRDCCISEDTCAEYGRGITLQVHFSDKIILNHSSSPEKGGPCFLVFYKRNDQYTIYYVKPTRLTRNKSFLNGDVSCPVTESNIYSYFSSENHIYPSSVDMKWYGSSGLLKTRPCQWPGGQLLLTMICETKLLFQLTGENLPKFESSH